MHLILPWFATPTLALGPASIDAPSLLAAVGLLAAMAFVRHRAERAGLSVRRSIDGVALIVALALVLGHFFDVLIYRPADLAGGLQALLPWNGGICSLGSLLGVAIGAALAFRSRDGAVAWDHLDALAPALLLGLIFARAGCFLGHHHAGCRTQFPLAVDYPGGPRHDLGLLEALIAAALLAGAIALERRLGQANRRPAHGAVSLGIASAYALGRFGLEFLRGADLEQLGRISDPRYCGLTLVQYGAVVLVAVCFAGLARSGWTRPPTRAVDEVEADPNGGE